MTAAAAAFSVAHCYTSPLNSSSPHPACKTDGVNRCSVVAPSAWSNGYTLLVVVVTDRHTGADQHDHVEC